MLPAALELKSVTKKFNDTAAVSDLSMKIAPGEIYGLIGPNGSGKTTTIKMIAGLYKPTGGVILVCGHDIAHAPTNAKKMIGYIPDDPVAYDRLSGREFMEFVGQLFSMDRKKRDKRIEDLLARYGLGGLADGRIERYSRGTRQKISILAALLHEPALLLIDEPMVGLDPASARVTKELIKEFADRGGAVLISTHTLPIAETLCAHIGILKDGKLTEEGTVAELGAKAGIEHGSLEDYYLALTA
jgi:ABC-2 type transport system ATP-binding protein